MQVEVLLALLVLISRGAVDYFAEIFTSGFSALLMDINKVIFPEVELIPLFKDIRVVLRTPEPELIEKLGGADALEVIGVFLLGWNAEIYLHACNSHSTSGLKLVGHCATLPQVPA